MDGNDLVRQLRELADLQAQGTLTPDEFAAVKARLLGAAGDTRPPAYSGMAPMRPPEPGDGVTGAPIAGVRTAAPEPERPEIPMAPPGAAPISSDPFGTSGYGPPYSPPPYAPPFGAPMDGPMAERGSAGPAAMKWGGSGPATAIRVGGAVALLSFVALPMASVPFLGSITGAGLASHASEVGALGWLWLVLIGSLAVTGLGAWQRFAANLVPAVRRRAAIATLLCACLIVLIYLIVFAALQNAISSNGGSGIGISASDLLGAGFWFALLGALVAAVGAVLQLRRQ